MFSTITAESTVLKLNQSVCCKD